MNSFLKVPTIVLAWTGDPFTARNMKYPIMDINMYMFICAKSCFMIITNYDINLYESNEKSKLFSEITSKHKVRL